MRLKSGVDSLTVGRRSYGYYESRIGGDLGSIPSRPTSFIVFVNEPSDLLVSLRRTENVKNTFYETIRRSLEVKGWLLTHANYVVGI